MEGGGASDGQWGGNKRRTATLVGSLWYKRRAGGKACGARLDKDALRCGGMIEG